MTTLACEMERKNLLAGKGAGRALVAGPTGEAERMAAAARPRRRPRTRPRRKARVSRVADNSELRRPRPLVRLALEQGNLKLLQKRFVVSWRERPRRSK